MENTNVENLSVRKKIYKKAAVLAALATITGVASTSTQKAEKSEAIFGLIVGVVSTVMGIGTGIAESVNSSRQNAEQLRMQREEEERIRKEQEAERIAQALKDPKNDVRLQQELAGQQEKTSKVINMQIADNSDLSNKTQAVSVFRNNSLHRPANPPKDVHVGGFGADIEEEEDNMNFVEQEVENESSVYSLNNPEQSNIVRFSLNDLGDEELDELVSQTNSEDILAELNVEDIMTEQEAINHELVQLGYLNAEELILLDFGIRNGSINQEILDKMLEEGIVTSEYYEGACYLISSINEEQKQVNNDLNKVNYQNSESNKVTTFKVNHQKLDENKTIHHKENKIEKQDDVSEELNYEDDQTYEELNYENDETYEEVDYEDYEEVDYDDYDEDETFEEYDIDEDEFEEGFGVD